MWIHPRALDAGAAGLLSLLTEADVGEGDRDGQLRQGSLTVNIAHATASRTSAAK
jgi:hypothetical protein